MNKLTHKEERQKVFDAVAVGLMQQKVACYSTKQSSCPVLISADGKRCGLGMLLPKEWTSKDSSYLEGLIFSSNIEEHSIQQTSPNYKFQVHKQRSFIDEIKAAGYHLSWEQDRLFLGKLQDIHDIKQPYDWFRALQELAFNYGLDQTKLYQAMCDNNYDVTASI